VCSVLRGELPFALFELSRQNCIYRSRRLEVFRLEAAQFLQRTMKRALGRRAGAVDRDLEAVEFFVRHIFRGSRFDRGAAAETPGGVDDFSGEGLFERRRGREFRKVARFELIEDVLLFGADEAGDGEQAESGCVLGDSGLAFGRNGAGGPFGVLPVGGCSTRKLAKLPSLNSSPATPVGLSSPVTFHRVWSSRLG
jgi:hypothetical protein